MNLNNRKGTLKNIELDIVAYIYNPSTGESETERSLY